MLFPADLYEPIARGEVTLAFRRWKRPTVKAGGTLVTPVGVLAIDEVSPIAEGDVTEADARAAGRATVAEALGPSRTDDAERMLYRIRFHVQGADPRIELRSTSATGDDLDRLVAALDRLDRASDDGPWTRRYLALVDANPGVRAGDLAPQVGQEKERFKIRVRRLKGLGLTESLGTGYRTSPRYRSLADAVPWSDDGDA